MGYPTSGPMGYADVNSGNNAVTSLSSPVDGGSRVKAFEKVENGVPETDQMNQDSPCSGNGMLVEDRPPVGDEDLESVAAPLPSVSRSNIELKWSDIASYATKRNDYIQAYKNKFLETPHVYAIVETSIREMT